MKFIRKHQWTHQRERLRWTCREQKKIITSNPCTFLYVTYDRCHIWCHRNIEKVKSNGCIYFPDYRKNTATQWWEQRMSGVIFSSLINSADRLTANKENKKNIYWVMYRRQVTLTEWETQAYQVLLPWYLWLFWTMHWFLWSTALEAAEYTYNRNILYPHLLL